MKKECIAMLLAGGQGSRLYVLTSTMAKPAVPFGGKFRIIDFPLSNCTNSGIDTVGVLTQYRPLELSRHIGSGQTWDLDSSTGGVHILPPYQSVEGGGWYKGTANAIYQNIGFVDRYDPDYVVILSGDHIYKMDYAKMLAQHKKRHAAYIEQDYGCRQQNYSAYESLKEQNYTPPNLRFLLLYSSMHLIISSLLKSGQSVSVMTISE